MPDDTSPGPRAPWQVRARHWLRGRWGRVRTLNVTRLENGLDPGRMAWSPADLRAEANRLDVSDRDEWRSRLTLGQMGE